MPQNGHQELGSMRIIIADSGQDAAVCTIQSLRHDIWLGIVPDAHASKASLQVHCDEAVMALTFLVPRTGKGGEGKLPAGSLCIFPAGINTLPELSGRGLILCMTTSRLMNILGTDAGTVPACMRSLLDRKCKQVERIHISLTPEQILAGNALIHCHYEGAVRNLFFKSKVLELLALFLGQVEMQEKTGNVIKLSVTDQQIIAEAREFLLRHIEEPPRVSQIARHVGVNDTKLKRLFKKAYGLSPYACLRLERLTAAREMILAKDMNVSEAATSVGYSNISHFIAAFTRQYGIRPGELRARKN